MAVRWSCYIRELCRSGHLRSCSRIYHPSPEPTGNNYGSRERTKAQAELWEMLDDPPKRWSDKQRNELERLDTVTTPWLFSFFLHSYKTDLFFTVIYIAMSTSSIKLTGSKCWATSWQCLLLGRVQTHTESISPSSQSRRLLLPLTPEAPSSHEVEQEASTTHWGHLQSEDCRARGNNESQDRPCRKVDSCQTLPIAVFFHPTFAAFRWEFGIKPYFHTWLLPLSQAEPFSPSTVRGQSSKNNKMYTTIKPRRIDTVFPTVPLEMMSITQRCWMHWFYYKVIKGIYKQILSTSPALKFISSIHNFSELVVGGLSWKHLNKLLCVYCNEIFHSYFWARSS